MDPYIWSRKSRTTSLNILRAAMWGYGMKTCQRRWTIGRSGERGSGISVLAAQHDDDDDELFNQIFLFYDRNLLTHNPKVTLSLSSSSRRTNSMDSFDSLAIHLYWFRAKYFVHIKRHGNVLFSVSCVNEPIYLTWQTLRRMLCSHHNSSLVKKLWLYALWTEKCVLRCQHRIAILGSREWHTLNSGRLFIWPFC